MCRSVVSRLAAGSVLAGVLALAADRAAAQQAVVAETGVSAPAFGPTYQTAPEAPSISCNAGGCLAAWRESRTGAGYGVWARRLSVDGTPQGQASFLVPGTGSGAGDPAIATDGSRFMVATTDFQSNIIVTRLDPDGTSRTVSMPANVTLDGGLLTSSPRVPAIAFGGGGYLVSYAFGPGSSTGPVLAFRVDADGNILDQSPMTITSDSNEPDAPAVAWTNTQFVVVWNQRGQALAARVSSDGTVMDPGGFLVAPMGSDTHRPRLVFGGGALLLAV
jgi:hypothetical protein